MVVSQGNSMCRYLNQKCHFFPLSFTKSETSRAEQVLSGGVDTSGRGEEVGKACKRVNMV
jgi:hypothetical protein